MSTKQKLLLYRIWLAFAGLRTLFSLIGFIDDMVHYNYDSLSAGAANYLFWRHLEGIIYQSLFLLLFIGAFLHAYFKGDLYIDSPEKIRKRFWWSVFLFILMIGNAFLHVLG